MSPRLLNADLECKLPVQACLAFEDMGDRREREDNIVFCLQFNTLVNKIKAEAKSGERIDPSHKNLVKKIWKLGTHESE